MASSGLPSPATAATAAGQQGSFDASLAFQRSDSTSSATSPVASAPKIRRRNRVIASCLECRRRKLKCDKQAPCTNCSKFRRDCLYLAPALDSVSQKKLVEIKEKMGSLEKTLERDVARRASAEKAPSRQGSLRATAEDPESDEDDLPVPEDEKDLEPTPLAALDQVYDDDADDEIMDLGVQLGKMRVAERIGGFVRPKMVEELTATLGDARSKEPLLSGTTLPFGYNNIQWRGASQPDSYLAPGPDYIAPASNFFFPDPRMTSYSTDFLPSKNTADKLIMQYWFAVHQIARIVHRPTFEKQYAFFWDHISIATEPPAPLQAVVLAALFSAAVTLGDDEALQHFGTTKNNLVDRLKSSTELALSKANFLRTTKIDTMQAFVMYLIPLCRAEISRAHSALTGTAIRLAECMGLHRDGSHYGLTPVEVHVRRLIWYQLCFLDIRTCEATGPRPQIHKEDFDSKIPPNVNESDLLGSTLPTEDLPQFTDMTLCKIRFECIELHRQLWVDMPRIDQKKISLTSVLGKIQKFRAAMEAKYFPILDESVPIQMMAKRIYSVLSNRPFIMVLHRYFYGAAQSVPGRLKNILVEASCICNEGALDMDAHPKLKPWSWYRGAFFQYHSALLLLVYVYTFPDCLEATRIWKTLDYIFDLPASMPSRLKAEGVISELRDRMEVYQSMRKMRTTTNLRAVMGEWSWSKDENTRVNADAKPGIQAAGRMNEVKMDNFGPGVEQMHPAQYSPPPLAPRTDSVGSPETSLPGSAATTNDVQMETLAEIDWAEWDQYFPPAPTPAPAPVAVPSTTSSTTGSYDVSDVDLGSFPMFNTYNQRPYYASRPPAGNMR